MVDVVDVVVVEDVDVVVELVDAVVGAVVGAAVVGVVVGAASAKATVMATVEPVSTESCRRSKTQPEPPAWRPTA